MSAKRRKQTLESKPVAVPLSATIQEFSGGRAHLIAVVLVVVASIRIVATYDVFNHTSDEPAHVACGMEWLDKGIYQWEPQHPPLARVATAILPYVWGIRSQNTPRNKRFAMGLEGAAILYAGGRYDRNLALARLGILPFFWAACAVVYAWGLRFFSRPVAVTGVLLFSFLPPVLAHGGLATTDMALTATMGAAFLTGLIWLESPTKIRALWFGVATGLMVLSKFSSLVFFPASTSLTLIWYLYRARPSLPALAAAVKTRLPSFLLAIAAGMLVIWAGYRFSFGDSGFGSLRLPAPELYAGIRQVMLHDALGHEGYLLGERGMTGFWLYFPVALCVKSPLGFLVLLAVGLVVAFRKETASNPVRVLLAFSAGIMMVAMFSRINIGIRHILPIYLALSLLGAAAALRLLEWADTRKWLRFSLLLLMAWFAGSSVLSHPDYLPYFNELAGSEPERIMADSDLDWGQDLKRLAARLHELGATEVAFDPYIIGDPEKALGFPPVHFLNRNAPLVGWNAIGIGLWKLTRVVLWPDSIKPRERVGKSILLWYFPPAGANGGNPPR